MLPGYRSSTKFINRLLTLLADNHRLISRSQRKIHIFQQTPLILLLYRGQKLYLQHRASLPSPLCGAEKKSASGNAERRQINAAGPADKEYPWAIRSSSAFRQQKPGLLNQTARAGFCFTKRELLAHPFTLFYFSYSEYSRKPLFLSR